MNSIETTNTFPEVRCRRPPLRTKRAMQPESTAMRPAAMWTINGGEYIGVTPALKSVPDTAAVGRRWQCRPPQTAIQSRGRRRCSFQSPPYARRDMVSIDEQHYDQKQHQR